MPNLVTKSFENIVYDSISTNFKKDLASVSKIQFNRCVTWYGVNRKHMKAVTLKKFQHVLFYANANNDNSFPYCTSSLSKRNPYKQYKLKPDSNGKAVHVIENERVDLN